MTRNEWEQIVLQETVDQRLEWRAQGGFRLASTWSPPPFTRPGARGNPLTIHPVASNLKLVIENVWQVGRYNLQFRFSVSTVLVVVRLRNRHAIKCNSPTFICSKHQTRANRLVSLPVLIFFTFVYCFIIQIDEFVECQEGLLDMRIRLYVYINFKW